MNSEAESINNFKFLIELSITQFSEFFNFKLIEKFTGFGGEFSQKNQATHLFITDKWPMRITSPLREEVSLPRHRTWLEGFETPPLHSREFSLGRC